MLVRAADVGDVHRGRERIPKGRDKEGEKKRIKIKINKIRKKIDSRVVGVCAKLQLRAVRGERSTQ